MMTDSQLQTLAAQLRASADETVVTALAEQRYDLILDWCNAPHATFYVWRTNVSRSEIYHATSGEGTTWNWTTYKNQSQGEQGAWVQMFMGDRADFSLDNLRAGVDAIFSGSGAQATQRAHVYAAAKRKASNCEHFFVTGTGSLATPGKLGWEGPVTLGEVSDALNRF